MTDDNDIPGSVLGVDFGRNGTVVVPPDAGDLPGVSRALDFPGWSRIIPSSDHGDGTPVIPSLIHYRNDGSFIIGDEVEMCGIREDPATARWIQHYIVGNSSVQIPVGNGEQIGYRQAGSNFLSAVLSVAMKNRDPATTRVLFTVPPESPPAYTEWIRSVAALAGVKASGTIDDAAAIAEGYGIPLATGSPCVVIIELTVDSLDVLVAARDDDPENSGICSRILGRAAEHLADGGIDSWLAHSLPGKQGLYSEDERVQRILPSLVRESKRMREELVTNGESSLKLADPASLEITARLERADLLELFREHSLPATITGTIGRALSAARLRGFDPEQVTAVLMTGEISAFPEVQAIVREKFPEKPVLSDHPLDAAARGAAIAACSLEKDCIRYDYALRYWDPVAREHRYRFLVRNGTRYPSAGQVARITISAAYDGQTHLGIPLCRIGSGQGNSPDAGIELIGAMDGGVRLAGPPPDSNAPGTTEWVNRNEPVFLVASPPALKGEPRFEITFTIDGSKRLCITARDVTTGIIVKKDAPVFRLK